jgi:hypothetical protein
MNPRTLTAKLHEHGFHPEREARHGVFWSDGSNRILVARAASFRDPRAAKNVLADLQRTIRKRDGVRTVIDAPAPPHPPTPVPLCPDPIVYRQQQPLSNEKREETMTPTSLVPVEKPESPCRRKGWPTPLPLADRAKLRGRIAELRQKGLSYSVITRQLNSEGFKSGDGGADQDVLRFECSDQAEDSAKEEGRSGRAGDPCAHPLARATTKLPDTVMAILTDPALSDRSKVRMIAAYAEE